MDCPVCKYPNPQGATHCGMCYEVFNRSAAQAYMHAVKRDRQLTEDPAPAKIISQRESVVERADALVKKIDWEKVAFLGRSWLKRSQKGLWIAVGLGLACVLANFLFDASLWYHLFGKKLEYTLAPKGREEYMIGLTQSIKSWSERQGRLDTPMEEFKIEEIGSVSLEREKSAAKDRQTFQVRAQEWIQIRHDSAGSSSHAIPLNHPSLSAARVIFDKKGTLLERRYALSPRLAKGLPFLAPKFPKTSLHRGQTWTEAVEWLDVYNDWRIDWAGTLRWRAGELEPCGADTCVRLTYQADLNPQLKAAPSWAGQKVKALRSQVSTEGSALFDVGHKRLVSNTFSYDGLLYIPLADLGLIPWELRIGRRVKGVAGEVVLRFENKIDVRKN